MNYYNGFDPYVTQQLRNLIRKGLLPLGVVDERSIVDVRAEDLAPYTQCHFFAGIGGWSRALHLASWPASRPVWTGSCPCQPLSCAGKRGGEKDERHLWPEFYRLISECRPECVFGEQVGSKDGLEWLDGISLDLEELGYAVGSSDLPAAGVGAPHIRQRVFWMAHAGGLRSEQPDRHDAEWGRAEDAEQAGVGCELGRMEHPTSDGRQQGRPESDGRGVASGCGDGGMGNSHGGQLAQHSEQPAREERQALTVASGAHSRMGHADGCGGGQADIEQQGRHTVATVWSQYRLIPCRDGKVRRISPQPGDVPLAYGLPRDVGRMFPRLAGMVKAARSNRVGRLRGYGNAIVPHVAAEFITACGELDD